VIFVFRNETHCDKLNLVEMIFNVQSTWMCFERGEGEEEIDNHGRSRVKEVSSQGTICNGQLKGPIVLRMRAERPTQKTNEVQDARHDSDSTPHFFFPISI